VKTINGKAENNMGSIKSIELPLKCHYDAS
jgi:hypothetical protein